MFCRSSDKNGDLDQPQLMDLLRPPLAHYMGAVNATWSRPLYGVDCGLLGIIFRPRPLSLTLHRRRSSDVALALIGQRWTTSVPDGTGSSSMIDDSLRPRSRARAFLSVITPHQSVMAAILPEHDG
jgi:hypothetical protein